MRRKKNKRKACEYWVKARDEYSLSAEGGVPIERVEIPGFCGEMEKKKTDKKEAKKKPPVTKARPDELPEDALRLLQIGYSLINVAFPIEAWKQPQVPDSGASTFDCIEAPDV